MSIRNIYAPTKFKDFLTCARVKSIAEYIDSFDESYDGEINLYFTNERKDIELDSSCFKDSLNINSKGYIIVTKSELIKETSSRDEVVFAITQNNIEEVKEYLKEFESYDESYLYQDLSASLYLTDITITDKNNSLIAHIKDTDSEMTLIRGLELKEDEDLGEYAYLKNEVFKYGFKTIEAYKKKITSHYNLRDSHEYIISNPCETCENTCSDYDWDKLVEIEWGWVPFKLSDINDSLVLEYIRFIKSEIQEAKNYIVNHRKEKGRIDYNTVMRACSFEISACRYFGAIAYCHAVDELGIKPNPRVLKDKIIGTGFLFEGEDTIDLQEFIDFGNSFGVDVIKELDIPESLLDLYHKSKKNLD